MRLSHIHETGRTATTHQRRRTPTQAINQDYGRDARNTSPVLNQAYKVEPSPETDLDKEQEDNMTLRALALGKQKIFVPNSSTISYLQ